MPTSHIAIRQTIFSTKVSKLIYFPSLIMPNCLITFIKIHNWLLSELNQYTCHGTWFLCVYFVTWSYGVNLVIRVYLDIFCNPLKILVVNMSTPKRKWTGLIVVFYSETVKFSSTWIGIVNKINSVKFVLIMSPLRMKGDILF